MNEDEHLAELLGSVSAGDEDSFSRLYEITSRRVFQYLCRLTHNKTMAEDVLIDTYTEIWRSARNFRGHSRVLTWITGIARNLALNGFRKCRMTECEIDADMTSPPEQFGECVNAEMSRLLQRACDRLPANQREALDLLFMQGMRYEEISAIMDIPVNTVKTRVFHAKEKLRSILAQMGVKKSDVI
jgi:RNA polymerase sigma-70 factor (ECF subfamily)